MKTCLWFALILCVFSSCRSYKEATLLLDLNRPGQVDIRSSSTFSNYKLRPKDNVYVSVVSSNAEMNRIYNPAQSGSPAQVNNNYEGETNRNIYGYVVDENGNIQLPLLGLFYVQGKTLKETQDLIQTKAEGLFKDVTAKVRLLNYKVTIIGEVKTPGIYYNNDGDFSVLDAISRAQGLTEFALLEEVLVLRQNKSNAQDAYIMNLTSKTALHNEAFYLMPDDVVVIKPAKNKNRQLRAPAQNWIIPSVSAVLVLLNYLKNN